MDMKLQAPWVAADRALGDSGVSNLGTKGPVQAECDLKSQGLEQPTHGQI